MRWPIRNQILYPVAATMLTAAAVISVTAAYLAARQSGAETLRHLDGVVSTLGESSFPYTNSVLEKMRGLSGAHFMAVNADGEVTASTLSTSNSNAGLLSRVPLTATLETLTEFESVELDERWYFVARVAGRPGAPTATLLVFFPERDWRQSQWAAAWPPLAVGGVTVVCMVFIAVGLSHRLGRRIQALQRLFTRLANGQFEHATAEPPEDEVFELVLSANRLSDQLSSMREQIAHTERLRLLAQLAGGLAHQLRNAVTGARMGIQLHQRRCDANPDDQSLEVALRQLEMTEEQIKGLLSLGTSRPLNSPPAELDSLLEEVWSLVQPVCRHARVDFRHRRIAGDWDITLQQSDQVKAAVLNLVLNGIEAAGVGGLVTLSAAVEEETVTIQVADNGPGPDPAVAETMFEPFVSSKPEGVGLGLAMAWRTAEDQNGTLTWNRADDQTVFLMTLPIHPQQRNGRKRLLAHEYMGNQ